MISKRWFVLVSTKLEPWTLSGLTAVATEAKRAHNVRTDFRIILREPSGRYCRQVWAILRLLTLWLVQTYQSRECRSQHGIAVFCVSNECRRMKVSNRHSPQKVTARMKICTGRKEDRCYGPHHCGSDGNDEGGVLRMLRALPLIGYRDRRRTIVRVDQVLISSSNLVYKFIASPRSNLSYKSLVPDPILDVKPSTSSTVGDAAHAFADPHRSLHCIPTYLAHLTAIFYACVARSAFSVVTWPLIQSCSQRNLPVYIRQRLTLISDSVPRSGASP